MSLVPSLHAGAQFGNFSFSNDSKFLFSCCGHVIKVFNTVNGECLRDLKAHTKAVTGVVVNPSNSLQIISCGQDGLLIYWDYLDGVKLKVHDLHIPLYAIVAINAEKKLLIMLAQTSAQTNSVGVMVWKKSKHGDTYATPKVLINSCEPDLNCVSYGCMREYVAAASHNKLFIHSMRDCGTKTVFDKDKYNKDKRVLCVACHPSEYYIAAGLENGRILLWHNICLDSQPVPTTLHWHALPVMCLDFSPDGSILLSGGHECVLVRWQMGDRNQKDFKPRMGAPIKAVSTSPDGNFYATRHADNVIQLLDINLNILHVYRGMTRTTFSTADDPDPIPCGLVFDPRSRAIISNGLPGHLQFYSLTLNKQLFNLDIVGQNYISPESMDRPKVITDVSSVAVSSSGEWLATFEEWDDNCFTPERRLKFWIYRTESQTYSLNTTVEHPHDERLLTMLFQPLSDKENEKSKPPTLVTLGEDCYFKLWTLIDDSDIYRQNVRWNCDSVGFYRGLKPFCADFSADGTLLAVGFEHLLTLWDPENVVVRASLSHKLGPEEKIIQVKFGNQRFQHNLVVLTRSALISWNLLTLHVLWKIGAQGTTLVRDPSSELMAFVTNWGTLCIFRPDDSCPVYMYENISAKKVVDAVFVPDARHDKIADMGWPGRSQIYLFNVAQELITLDLPEKPSKSEDVLPLSQNLPLTAMAAIMAEKTTRDKDEKAGGKRRGHRETAVDVSEILPLNEPVSMYSEKFLNRHLVKRKNQSNQAAAPADLKLWEKEDSDQEGSSSSESDMDIDEGKSKTTMTKTTMTKTTMTKTTMTGIKTNGGAESAESKSEMDTEKDMNVLLSQSADWVKWCSSLSLK